MIFIIASIVFVVDRLTKMVAVNNLFLGEPLKVIPNFFHLTLVLNRGTAFGLLRGWGIIFIILSVAVIAWIAVYARRHKNIDNILIWVLGLIMGGALGNLYDRVLFGCVIDFFDFRIWPVFNVADSCITIAVGILAWQLLIKKKNFLQ